MNEITINDLPNELIIDILKRLDSVSMKYAVLTCKLWKQLIESSCTWSLVLNDKNLNQRLIHYCLTTNRQFHTKKISNCLELIEDNVIGNNSIVEIFKRLGSRVVKLAFIDSCIDNLNLFAKMLKCLPNLEHVILYDATTLGGVSDVRRENDLPELIKLKTLEIIDSEYCLIKCFKRSQVETIKIQSSLFGNNVETLTNFLRTQQHLTTLALRAIDYEVCQPLLAKILDGGGMRFHLTKLSLLDIHLGESQNDSNIILQFIKHHAKTIKDLELGTKFSNLVYEFVFANFKNLKSLQLMVNEFPKDKEFHLHLEENRSVNNLILTDFPTPHYLNNDCQQSLKELIWRVPNITNLTLLDKCDKETVLFIASNLNELMELTVKYFNGFVFGGVQFPKLKKLNIHKLDAEIDWYRFTRDNSRITELSIETVADDEALQCYDIENITKNLNLQTLQIGENYIPDPSFFDIIRKNCPKLKILHLHDICDYELLNDDDEHDMGLGDVPGLRFCDLNTYCTAMYCKGLMFWNDDNYVDHFSDGNDVDDDDIDDDDIDVDDIDDDDIDDDDIDDDDIDDDDIDDDDIDDDDVDDDDDDVDDDDDDVDDDNIDDDNIDDDDIDDDDVDDDDVDDDDMDDTDDDDDHTDDDDID